MKQFVLTILLGLCTWAVWSQTGVNPCNASITFAACTTPTSAALLNSWYSGSGASTFPSCGINPTTGQYWVRYVAGSTYNFIRIGALRPNGASRIDNPAFEVYAMTTAGSCPSTQPTLSLVACVNNNAGTANEYHYMSVTNGTTYYIRFFDGDGSSSGSTNFQYCITQYVPGDHPCNALTITPPFVYNGTTVGKTNIMTGGCNGKDAFTFGNAPDMFFRYTSTGNEWVTLNLTGTTSGNYTELTVMTATSCNGPFSCYYNTNNNGTFGGGLQATPGFSDVPCRSIYLGASGTYYFRVDADNVSETGPFILEVNAHPANNGDECSSAIELTSSTTYSFDNSNCSFTKGPNDPTAALLCAGTIENTHWSTFTSDNIGSDITISLSNISCSNPDYYAGTPPIAAYANGWQFGILTGGCGGPFTGVYCTSGTMPTNTLAQHVFTPTPNTKYYFVMDGNAGAECSWDINVSGISLLPSEMLSFVVTSDNGDASISWEAIHEKNTSHYELQHSTDGKTFEPLGSWSAQGAVEEPASYSFVHQKPGALINYYRIRQADFNGEWSYSPIRQVKLPREHSVLIDIYPVPASEQINVIYYASKGGVQPLRLMSLSGITVWNSTCDFSSDGVLQIPVSHLSPGIYFLEVHMPDAVERHQIVIQ